MTYSSLSGRWPTYTLPVDGCDLLICRKFVLTEKLSVIHLVLTFFRVHLVYYTQQRMRRPTVVLYFAVLPFIS